MCSDDAPKKYLIEAANCWQDNDKLEPRNVLIILKYRWLDESASRNSQTLKFRMCACAGLLWGGVNPALIFLCRLGGLISGTWREKSVPPL